MGSTLRWSRDAFLDSVGVDVALLFFWLVFCYSFFTSGVERDGWMQHTLLVIGAAIERAAKATAAKNVDFMLMDLSDEVEKKRFDAFVCFQARRNCRAYWKCFFTKEKTSVLPIPLMLLAARSRTQNFLPLSGGTFVSYRSVVLALAMHTIAVTSEGIAMGRRKDGSIASVPFRHKSVSQQPMRAWPRDDLHQSCTSCVLN